MVLRAHHYGVSFIMAAVVFGALAVFAGESRGASAGSPKLTATLAPATAQLTVGKSASFFVYGVYDDGNGHTSNVMPVTISWLPVGGTVASYKDNTVVIKAGTVAKAGNLGVDITYDGLSSHADAPLQIIAASAPATPQPTPVPATRAPAPTASPVASRTPVPVLATPSTLSSADAARLGALTSIFRPAAATNSAPSVSLSVLGCLENNLGATRFAAVSGGQSQPTAADRDAASICFAGPEPVPAILAPVLPADVKNLSQDDIITITEVKKIAGAAGSDSKSEGLLLSGKGKPDTSVYLYVFSDPMVRRAQTNASGDWTYSLTAALPVGHHEIFAVAETIAATFVRTHVYPVEIAAAVDTSNSPAKAKSGFTTTQLVLAGVSALMLVLGLITFVAVIRRRRSPSLKSTGAAPGGAPGATVMPTVNELIAAAPMAHPDAISVDQIINTPIGTPSTGSTFLPGGTVPEEYRDISQAPARGSDQPKS